MAATVTKIAGPAFIGPKMKMATYTVALDNSYPSGGEAKFRQALEAEPGNMDARYGLGYALLKQGSAAAAGSELCAVLRGGVAVDVEREVKGLLDKNELKCD
mgnify:CR=1 FL=1